MRQLKEAILLTKLFVERPNDSMLSSEVWLYSVVLKSDDAFILYSISKVWSLLFRLFEETCLRILFAFFFFFLLFSDGFDSIFVFY